MRSTPRVVIVHDYLTQRGGAERVVLAMLETFPDARLVTSIYAPGRTFPEFGRYDVTTLLGRSTPLFRRDPRLALPILATVFSRATIRDADVVVCSSSGWSHGIGSTAPKVVYCHTPARWLHEAEEYARGHSLPARVAARVARPALRQWDAHAAASAHTYLVNSTFVAKRVQRVYGRKALVVHPPPGILPDGPCGDAPVAERNFLLTVARARGYKNTAAVIGAARRLGVPLVVVGGGEGRDPTGVTRLSRVDDASLRWLYANCRALVAAAHEDFGLTPVEAMAFGKPVVALRAGGYLDSVVEGKTGVFFDSATPAAIANAVEALGRVQFDPSESRRHAARFSREHFSAALSEIVLEVIADGSHHR